MRQASFHVRSGCSKTLTATRAKKNCYPGGAKAYSGTSEIAWKRRGTTKVRLIGQWMRQSRTTSCIWRWSTQLEPREPWKVENSACGGPRSHFRCRQIGMEIGGRTARASHCRTARHLGRWLEALSICLDHVGTSPVIGTWSTDLSWFEFI